MTERNFYIKEYKTPTNFLYGVPYDEVDTYAVIRKKDERVIKTFWDYLEAIKYLEALEDRYWLVS